jgi:hypothetical protein
MATDTKMTLALDLQYLLRSQPPFHTVTELV